MGRIRVTGGCRAALLAALAFVAAPALGKAEPAPAGGPPGVVKIAVSPFEPFVHEEGGEYVGFDADVLRMICAANGWTPQFTTMPFREALGAVERGEATIAAGAFYDVEARRRVVAFSRPYLDTGLVFVVRADGPSPSRARRVGVKAGATGEAEARARFGGRADVKIVRFVSTERSLEALLAGDVDAVLNDYINSVALIGDRYAGRLAIAKRWGAPWLLTHDRLAYPIDPARPDVKAAVDATLAELERGGTLERVRAKWLHVEMPPDWRRTALIAAVALACLAFAAGLTVALVVARGRARVFKAYWRLLEAFPDAVLVSSGGTFVYLNRAARRMLGAADDDDSRGVTPETLGRLAAGAVPGEGARFTPPGGGETRDVEVSATPVEFHGRAATQWVLRDVTDLRRARAELAATFERQSELLRFQEQMLETAAAFIAVVDRSGRVRLWNRAAERLTGVGRDEACAAGNVWAPLLGDQEDAFRDALEDALTSKPPLDGTPFDLRTKDGEPRVLAMFVGAMGGEDDPPLVVVGVDQTAERALAEQLEQSRKLEAMGRLAAGVAHEFNNMLQVIIGSAELVALNAAPETRARVDQILDAAGNGAGLARQLLLFGRRQPLKREPYDVDDLVASTARMLRPLLGEKIHLELRGGGAGAVLADRAQFQQALINLAANARDAMPDGGRFVLSTERREVGEDEARRAVGLFAGEWVVVAAEDTGVGMPAETIGRIFEPFFTTKPVGRGTGLGLAAVHGIVARHAGVITVESGPGRGARFAIYLRPAEVGAGRTATVVARARRTGETILLVEDDPEVREILAGGLAALGWDVRAAEGAASARNLNLTSAPAALVSDVQLADGSGPEIAAALRARFPGMPVLFVTGHGAAGLDDCPGGPTVVLSKPCTLSEMSEALRSLVAPEHAAKV
ncbi:MAG: transporter substrate-binding domain-containing protein [Candidatus Polarisedimenticolia bacterium]|nr:transporter substrate-binding domain-containing protein [bacterium]